MEINVKHQVVSRRLAETPKTDIVVILQDSVVAGDGAIVTRPSL